MRLGYNTNGFAHHPLEQALRIVAGLGYRSVAITVDHFALNPFAIDAMQEVVQVAGLLHELQLTHVLETGARYLLDPLQKHEPTLVSEDPSERVRRQDFYERVIDTAACLESDAVSIWSGVCDCGEETAWDRLLTSLPRVLDYAGERNVRIAFEPEPGMFIDTMQRFQDLRERLDRPDLWLTLDVGHLHCQGETPIPDVIHAWKDSIVNIHLEDMKQGVHEHLRLGKGEMDFPPILQALQDIEYGGGVHVELSRHSHLAPLVAAESLQAASVDVVPRLSEEPRRTTRVPPLVFLSVPGLRRRDLPSLPAITRHFCREPIPTLDIHFPAVTWPAQTTLLTGCLPTEHGVVANGHYWRDEQRVEMWTSPNQIIQRPQIWDRLGQATPKKTTAAWFPMLSKKCHADYVCMPAPVHNPDGSESLWCYTRPQKLYGELLESQGHFPLQNFWGPRASIASSSWIVRSAIDVARRYQPDFFYIYLPHLDYAAQAYGPNSPEAQAALNELNPLLEELADGMMNAYEVAPEWMIVSEYTIQPVDHVTYPNRRLREAGLLALTEQDGREFLSPEASPAWALVDHQLAHVFVQGGQEEKIRRVAELFRDQPGIAEVLTGSERAKYGIDHPRAGEVVLISQPNSWQAYYWWEEDGKAPPFATSVDIHRKPGFDPVELFWDPSLPGVPLDATKIRGSHGVPVPSEQSEAVLLTTLPQLFPEEIVVDTTIADRIVQWVTSP